MDMENYNKESVYLIHPENYVANNDDVYKFGMTKMLQFDRYRKYGKGSTIELLLSCKNSLNCERRIREEFKNRFILVEGNEYFRGNLTEMREIIYTIVCNENKYTMDIEKPSCKRKIYSTEINEDIINHKKRRRIVANIDTVVEKDTTVVEKDTVFNNSSTIFNNSLAIFNNSSTTTFNSGFTVKRKYNKKNIIKK